MHIWPVNSPQRSKIASRTSPIPDAEFNDNEVIQTIVLPESNLVIMLTPARVLVYNFKPLALVESHERSAESITDFGLNRAMTVSKTLHIPIKGLVSTKDVNYLRWRNGKLIFYVVTEKNCLLTYQIMKNSTNVSIFKDYGIPVVDMTKFDENEVQDYDSSKDDDTLVVFEGKKSNKVIQNGYTTSKKTGYLQFFTANQDNNDELPIRKLELRLKIVLKFDYEIIDIYGFKSYSELNEGTVEENLIILFPHGLQTLDLKDSKLKDADMLKFEDGRKICIVEDQLVVVSNDDKTGVLSVHCVNNSKQTDDVTELKNKGTPVTFCEFQGKLLIIYKDEVQFFNLKEKKVDNSWGTPFKVKLCSKIDNEVLLFVSEDNVIHTYTQSGNLLFSTPSNYDDDEDYPSYEYTDTTYLDMSLLLVTKSGDYELWSLWKEPKQTSFDFRSSKSYILQNPNNDIAIYSPQGDSPSNHDILQVIKPFMSSVNNCTSLIRMNVNRTLLAVHISNKNLLLIENLETNTWYTFTELTIMDMYWLENTYLVLLIRRDNGNMFLQCIRLPLQAIDPHNISSYIVWEYEIPENTIVHSLHVNSLFKYKLIKLKAKTNPDTENDISKWYKTAEIILATDTHLITIDVISEIHQSGINIIKKFHDYLKLNASSILPLNKIEWVTNFKDGFLIYCQNQIIKMQKSTENDWVTSVLLEDVENLIDVLKNDMCLIQKKQVIIISLDSLWAKEKPFMSIPLNEDSYPICISPGIATVHGLHNIFHKDSTKLVVNHDIYLDKLINVKLAYGVSPADINADYRLLKHYKFALEKILSFKIIDKEPLDSIVELIKMCDSPNVDGSFRTRESNMLEVVSNCLRKIETKYWKPLFTGLKLTPRDLLALCIEGNEVNALGALVLVFLNYNEDELVDDLRNEDVEENSKIAIEVKGIPKTSNTSVVNVLEDEELMLRLLKLLVTGAANELDPQKASGSWDMCFQLIRLFKSLDKENDSQLVKKAMDILK